MVFQTKTSVGQCHLIYVNSSTTVRILSVLSPVAVTRATRPNRTEGHVKVGQGQIILSVCSVYIF